MSKEAIAEFMAHLIIADDHIHGDQITILRDFIEMHGLEGSQKTIFSVLEGKGDVHYPELLENLKSISEEDQELLIQNSAAIIGFNCHFAKEEKIAVLRLCKETGIDTSRMQAAIKEIIGQAEKAREEIVSDDYQVDSFGALSLKVRRFFASGAKREYLSSRIRENELTGPEYSKAIKKTNEIAEVDCRLVEGQLASCLSTLDKTRKKLLLHLKDVKPSDENSSEEESNFFEFMKDLLVSLDVKAKSSMQEIQTVVDKKRRAKNAFTIALMGRTKAGKSTLHYVMTGEGADFIGVGSERTTRYNRVYEWENLRIIDTPGIGAAEAGGRDDEEIALSVVDTADVICYVVTNDSVQEVEFKFLSKIRDSNKPVFVLLNCKENLKSPPPKLKRFVKDPLHWYRRDDEQNLTGIVNRIERGVKEYYEGGSVTIIPVHLMAAKMAGEERYQKDHEALSAGSRMNEFFNEIRENVLELGQLRKSQTLLDGTVVRLSTMHQDISGTRARSLDMADEIENKLASLVRKVNDRVVRNRAAFLSALDARIRQEKSSALDFASDNYKMKKSRIESHWQSESKRIEGEVRADLASLLKKTEEEVRSYVQDAMDDIVISADFDGRGEFDDYSTLNTKRIASVVGTLISTGAGIALAVLGSNPIGWTVLGVGAFIGIVSGFMTSKEEKKRKAVAHMKEQVDKSLGSMKEGYEKHSEAVFNDFNSKLIAGIESVLGGIAQQYRSSSEILYPYIASLDAAIDKLNVQFAIRIIEFARDESLLGSLDSNSCPTVIRDPGKSISISTSLQASEKGISRARDAIREEIIINNKAGDLL